mgnify:CR=1 FL=1
MARQTPVPATDLTATLAALPGWSVSEGKLRRSFAFADFGAAIAFMVRTAFDAERLDHRTALHRCTNDTVIVPVYQEGPAVSDGAG